MGDNTGTRVPRFLEPVGNSGYINKRCLVHDHVDVNGFPTSCVICKYGLLYVSSDVCYGVT